MHGGIFEEPPKQPPKVFGGGFGTSSWTIAPAPPGNAQAASSSQTTGVNVDLGSVAAAPTKAKKGKAKAVPSGSEPPDIDKMAVFNPELHKTFVPMV